MLPRERVLTALSHRQPDRVPTDFWAVPEVWERLKLHFHTDSEDGVLDALQIDARFYAPDYIGPLQKDLPDGTFYRALGTHMKRVQLRCCEYDEYASYPLVDCETVEEIRAYPHWPSIEHWDWAGFSDKIGAMHDTYYTKLFVGGPFEDSWAMRGLEQFMIDMVDSPEIVHALMEERTRFFCEYIQKAHEVAGDKIDCYYTYDDIASQSGLLMSPAMWDEFIRPYHERLSAAIHSIGKTVLYHSCGSVIPLIDKLAALPIDVLNPLQPMAKDMDFAKIKQTFGDRLCFHGAICIQKLLPEASPQEVYDKTLETIRVLGKNGGYILAAAHHIQNDTPIENILAMYRAAQDSASL